MGQAPSIKEMQAAEDDFDAWVTKRTKAVVDECTQAREDLLKKFKEDVPDFDQMLTLRDKYWADFTHEETFSLAAISEVIRQVTGAIFGAPAGSPATAEGGVEVTQPASAAVDLAKYGNFEAMIAVKAMNLVAGLLEIFSSKASLKGTFQSGLDEVAPGLYVGISARRTEYSGESTFHGKTVIESYFVVLVKYSSKAEVSAQKMLDDMKNAEMLESYRTRFGDAFKQQLEKIDPFDDKEMGVITKAIENYDATLKALEGGAARTLA